MTRKIREKKYSRLEIKYYIIMQLKKNNGQENWKKDLKDHITYVKNC
jgi:hypothetical protein